MPAGKGYSKKGKMSMRKERTTGNPKDGVGMRAAKMNAKNSGKTTKRKK